jgi:hypothetical protein
VDGEDWSDGERDSLALNVVALIVGALGLGLVCGAMAVSVHGLDVGCRRSGCSFLVSPFDQPFHFDGQGLLLGLQHQTLAAGCDKSLLKAREIKFGDLTTRGDLIFERSGSGLNMDAGLLLFD